MTGSMLTPLPTSPLQQVAPNYSIDSFSEYSRRAVNRTSCSPTSSALGASGSRSARAKEEDEEIFRDLFADENDADTDAEALGRQKSTVPTSSTIPSFLPQKPLTQRKQSATENSNRRNHLAPMRPEPPHPVLSMPLIPRLKLEELVNARPDANDNNSSRRVSMRSSDLEQVAEEDESNMDGWQNDGLVHNGRFGSGVSLVGKNQRSNNSKDPEQETLSFLEKLELKSVLHTPRPDLFSFYPSMATTPTAISPHPNTFGNSVHAADSPIEDCGRPETNRNVKDRGSLTLKDNVRAPKADGLSARLAYMESMYGTAPSAPRKTRRETINRLANPISGHSSTLQALSPKQREKREAALTSRAPMSPISAAIAVSSRRRVALKKAGPAALLDDLAAKNKISARALATSKRKTVKRPDPLIQKRRYTSSTVPGSRGSTINDLSRQKGKTALASRSLVARKEALKKKLQRRSGAQRIGGSTFLTQRDEEEGVELIDDFIKRNRGAAQASLSFRSSKKFLSRRTVPSLHLKNAAPARSRPRPPQTRSGVPLARTSSTSTSAYRAGGFRTGRELESLVNISKSKTSRQVATNAGARNSRFDQGTTKSSHQPRRPQAWQVTSEIEQRGAKASSFPGRPTTPCAASANPLRKLKVRPIMPAMMPRAPKSPPSVASTLLMGSTPFFSLAVGASDRKQGRIPRQGGTTKPSTRKAAGNSSKNTVLGFVAPTKVSAQRRRTLTTLPGHTTTFQDESSDRRTVQMERIRV